MTLQPLEKAIRSTRLATGICILSLVAMITRCSAGVPHGAGIDPGKTLHTESLDPNRPPEPLTDVPINPYKAYPIIHKRMINDLDAILSQARFTIHEAELTQYNYQEIEQPYLRTAFYGKDSLDVHGISENLTRAASALGWQQMGEKNSLRFRKGSFFLIGTFSLMKSSKIEIDTKWYPFFSVSLYTAYWPHYSNKTSGRGIIPVGCQMFGLEKHIVKLPGEIKVSICHSYKNYFS
ncbi:hypothetical protein KEM60_01282 [Austwickia sp. TVS 96-490-7B]|uniref:hypothetical protein n=1 Tax=Austwickia sp. TVS 96-490-7B TaxID=2830843 RepID=UPI001C57CF25|nr:hypothetical protein [Austwickia sp. TVS 96-490-7B]MBW3085089.1 hypothetical protein [Austwickia sp. TVS 96-490-7B]